MVRQSSSLRLAAYSLRPKKHEKVTERHSGGDDDEDDGQSETLESAAAH